MGRLRTTCRPSRSCLTKPVLDELGGSRRRPHCATDSSPPLLFGAAWNQRTRLTRPHHSPPEASSIGEVVQASAKPRSSRDWDGRWTAVAVRCSGLGLAPAVSRADPESCNQRTPARFPRPWPVPGPVPAIYRGHHSEDAERCDARLDVLAKESLLLPFANAVLDELVVSVALDHDRELHDARG